MEVLNSIDMENLSLTYVEERLERKWNEKDIEKGPGVSPASPPCPVKGANLGCLLVGLCGGINDGYLLIWFNHQFIKPRGASIRATFDIPNIFSGTLLATGANDANSQDNSGSFIQTLSYEQKSSWVRRMSDENPSYVK